MGELAALTSSVCWAVASLLFAKLGQGIGPLALNLAKCALAFAMLAATLLVTTGAAWPAAMSSRHLGWLATSGLVGLSLGDTLYFAALVRLGARRALLLSALTPPITALLALPILDETLGLAAVVGMIITLAGVTWVILERTLERPRAERRETSAPSRLGIALGIGAAACQAGANVLVKLGGGGHDALPIAVVRLAAGVAGLVLVVAFRRRMGDAVRAFGTPRLAGLLFVATLIGTYLGIWLQVAGLNGAKAGVAATLSSTAPVFVLPLAVVFLDERPSPRAVFGALAAVAGIAILFVR